MKQETTRKCIVTGQILEKEKLLRFVVTPDNQIVPDFKKKLPGKGVYVVNAKTSLQKAIDANIFAKVLKKKVKVDASLINQVETVLSKNALSSVSLARKAGCLVCGMDKVKELLKSGKASFLLEASDAAEDGHNKIMSLAKNLEVFVLFKIEELDKELAKDNTVHLAFKKDKMAEAVRQTLVRLTSFLNN